MNLYWIKWFIFILFFVGCSQEKNQFEESYEIASSFVKIEDISDGTYFLFIPDGHGCTVCNTDFISKFEQLSNKKNLIIISDNYMLKKQPNFYQDTLERLQKGNLGFLGTTLLLKKENQFLKIITLDANTSDKLDSILNTIE